MAEYVGPFGVIHFPGDGKEYVGPFGVIQDVTSAAAAVTLDTKDSVHLHVVDATGFSQTHDLTAEDSVHTHAVDATVLVDADAAPSYAVINSTIPTTATTKSFTKAGFGTPQCYLVLYGQVDDDPNPRADKYGGIGFSDGTTEGSIGWLSTDGDTLTEPFRQSSNTNCVYANATGSHSQFITDGVELSFSSVSGNADYITVILFKGLSDYKAVIEQLTTNGANDITSIGFEPDFGLVLSVIDSTISATRSVIGGDWSAGAFHKDSNDTVTQAVVAGDDGTFVGDGDPNTIIRNDACVSDINSSGSEVWRASAGSFDANGLTLTTTADPSNSYVIILAMKGATGDEFDVSVIDTPTTTGDEAYTGVGFLPGLLGLIGTHCAAVNTIEQDGDAGAKMLGFADGSVESSFAYAIEDGVSTSDTQTSYATKLAEMYYDDGSSTSHQATLESFDSDGFTLNFSDTDGTARKWLALSFKDTSSAVITIDVQSSVHTQTSDQVGLDQTHAIQAEESVHTQTSDQVGIAQNHALATEDSIHDHAADNVGLDVESDIVAEDSVHIQASDVIGLAQTHALSVGDSVHAHASDQSGIDQTHALTAEDSVHAHTSDEVAFTAETTITAEDSVHVQSSDEVGLNQVHALNAENSAHTQTSGQAGISQKHELTAENAVHTHTAEEVEFIAEGALIASDSAHEHVSGRAGISQAHGLTVEDAIHTHTADEVRFVVNLNVEGAAHTHTAGAVGIDQTHLLAAEDSVHTQVSGQVGIQGIQSLTTEDSVHTHVADSVSLGAIATLQAKSAAHAHVSEQVIITSFLQLVTEDAVHIQVSDQVGVAALQTLAVENSVHTHTSDTVWETTGFDEAPDERTYDVLAANRTFSRLGGSRIYEVLQSPGRTYTIN